MNDMSSLPAMQVEENMSYVRLIDATGRCPPEDVGGPWGYEDFLAALADPQNPRHAELVEWYGSGFGPQPSTT